MEENRNLFSIKGYLGRKWYFIHTFVIGLVSGLLQFILCSDIFKEITRLAQSGESYSLYQISQTVPKNVAIIYLIIIIASWAIIYIPTKKRFTDMTGDENRSYIYSALIFIPCIIGLYALNNSLLYFISMSTHVIISLFLLFKRGKYVLPIEKS